MSSSEQAAGLCASCANSRVIRSARGSQFWICRLHDSDPHFPKYPRLPVLNCAGYVPGHTEP
jgi:hypothetical protein